MNLRIFTMALACAGTFLISMPLAQVQKLDSLESGQEKGYPWIAHSSVDAFYLASPAAASEPYQIALYQGFTIQSLSFASFHLGLRSRETNVPGLSAPYREPFAMKLSGTAELLRDFLYVSLGGNIPLFSGTIDPNDSLALYQTLNDYSPMPYNGFLSPRALEVGVFGRYLWSAWTVLGGVAYSRPARFDAVPSHSFFPSSYLDFVGRAILETGAIRHRVDVKTTLYGTEDNAQRVPAHDEGDLWQLRYGYLRSHTKFGWQAGIGVAVRMPDANRKLKIRSPLETTVSNDNIQRTYGEFSWSCAPKANVLLRAHLLPKALFTLQGTNFGHETEAGVEMGFKVWEAHRIRAAGSFLYGDFMDKQYIGFGIRGEFSFRHLGFQDLEEEADSEESQL